MRSMLRERRIPILALLALLAGAVPAGCRRSSADDPPDLDDDEVPYADVYPSLGRPDLLRIRGRLVAEEREDLPDLARTTPLAECSQDEIEDQALEIRLAGQRFEARTDEEGWFQLAIEGRALPPGEHEVAVGPRDSDEVWGRARARILPEDDPPFVVTSDIDLTYLVTDFHSKRALAKLLRQPAGQRVAFPGAAELYRGLAASERPVVFVSGSPTFFKRTLEAKMGADGIAPAGLFLKDFHGAIAGFDFGELEEQVGYKLEVLLAARLDLPGTSREVLLGDDSEADFVVYALYRDYLAGRIENPEALDAKLSGLGVSGRSRERVRERARALPRRSGDEPVLVSIIRRSGKPSEHHRLDEWLGPDLVAVDDTLQMALVLADRGLFDRAAVLAVQKAMLESADRDALREAAEAGSGAGLYRKEALEGLSWSGD